ncbi:hypothetical protein NB640_12505 [Oxalobacter vibrioformis]|uniref:Uncharacterized protein n=1 Tax=Oxalobacter vibrioformis TaxID=933080 RepID=A0A9E9P2L5_9BURK|nr:hypothetical protein [Oxalobacter vibrioformis]WAW10019.1 hypothetical protein NB640_12505 [Oxalobacter vibrioformis]
MTPKDIKSRIFNLLKESPRTVQALAVRLIQPPATIRAALEALRKETKRVRVVGWDLRAAGDCRLWGVGEKRNTKGEKNMEKIIIDSMVNQYSGASTGRYNASLLTAALGPERQYDVMEFGEQLQESVAEHLHHAQAARFI